MLDTGLKRFLIREVRMIILQTTTSYLQSHVARTLYLYAQKVRRTAIA